MACGPILTGERGRDTLRSNDVRSVTQAATRPQFHGGRFAWPLRTLGYKNPKRFELIPQNPATGGIHLSFVGTTTEEFKYVWFAYRHRN